MPLKPIHAIVAIAPDGAIGAKGRLAWDIPEDTRQFMALTEGGVMVEGPLCYAELGRALPRRGTVVVSRDPAKVFPGAERAGDLETAIRIAGEMPWPGPIWITGGERIYAEGLAWCDRLYVTRVGLAIQGDRFFPTSWERDFPNVLSRRASRQGEISLLFEVRGR